MPTQTVILFLILFALTGCSQRKGEITPPASSPDSSSPRVSKTTFLLKGSAVFRDKLNDVKDGNERIVKPQISWIDLKEVRLEILDNDLQITFINNGDIPLKLPQYESAIWTVTACSPDGNHCCTFNVQLIDKWYSGFQDISDAYYHKMDAPYINGNTIISKFPLSKLPEFMQKPFKWSAGSETGEESTREDDAPDMDHMVNFPQ